MISRFARIKGIGRYSNCDDLQDISFDRNTLIFGQNTVGKSTLTDILWSLKTGKPSFIEGRRTFGFKGSQEVELYLDQSIHQYPGPEWEKGFENIEIFDTHFINENIFEGNEINYEHQKNLHSVIIGPKGKELATEINSLQEELDELTARKSAKTSEFNKLFKKEISHDSFRKLPRLENPDQRIAELKAMIDNVNNQSRVRDVFNSIELLVRNITTQQTKEMLSATIEVKADMVRDHIIKTWKLPSASRDFLQTGLALTKDDTSDCVFCGQQLSLSAKSLLDAYGKLFSEEYKNLQTQISTAVSKFEKWQPVAFLNSIQDKLASINIPLSEIANHAKSELTSRKAAADLEFGIKLKNIDHAVNFDDFQFLIDFFKELSVEISRLRKKYVFNNEMDIALLEGDLKQIEFSRKRHTEEWDEFFKEYDEIELAQQKIKKIRERLREELNEYSTYVFSIHLGTINKILEELNADFKICDFQPIRKMVGQSERIFALEFFNQHKVGINETQLNRPNFKNTLSESDKRVLAFAFFYSLMLHDPALQEKIIVFDDPFSSFDYDRRTKAAELLANPYLITEEGEMISKEVNQLIVLTHDIEFFKWFSLKHDQLKRLRIAPDGESNGIKKSTIENFEL